MSWLDPDGTKILYSASISPEDQAAIDAAVEELSESIPVLPADTPPPRTDVLLADRAAMERYQEEVFDMAAFARNEKFVAETFELWDERAELEIKHDRAGVIVRLLEAANSGEGIRNAVDVRAAMMLLPQMRREAMASRDPKKLAEIQALEYAYLEGGTENARAMVARRFSPYRSVAERNLACLGSALSTIPKSWEKRIKEAMTPREKAQRIAAIREQIKKRVEGPGAKPESVKEEVRQLLIACSSRYPWCRRVVLPLLNGQQVRVRKVLRHDPEQKRVSHLLGMGWQEWNPTRKQVVNMC